MESGLTRLFLRKRSKSKPALITEPLPDTFQQTAGYDEFADGKPPTIGTRPIKPSNQRKSRKLFSHLRAKSTGLPEFSQLMNQVPGARPRTAPGIRPTTTEPSGPSRPRKHDRKAHDQPPMRWKGSRAPPEIPNLPNHVAGMKGPKYFDLLQAAVPTSTAEPLPKSTRSSFDIYNESIADRNSRYSKPLKPAANIQLRKALSTLRDSNTLATENIDPRRASFDAIRASRNFNATVSHAATESTSVVIPWSSASRVDNHSSQSPSRTAIRENLEMSDREKPDDFARQLASSDSHGVKRNNVQQTAFTVQSSRTVKDNLSSTLSASDPPASSPASRHRSGRKRSTTGPTVARSSNIAGGTELESLSLLTLKPVEHVSQQMKAASSVPHPPAEHTQSDSQGSFATRVQMSGNPPSSFAADDVPPPSSTVTRMTGGDPGRASSTIDGNENDVEIEDTLTHQADPTGILRSAVVPANNYVYRGGDDATLGNVLHHRRSRGFSQDESTGEVPSNKDLSVSSRSDKKDGTSILRIATSLVPPDSSDSALQQPLERTEEAGSGPVSVQRSPHLAPSTTSVEVLPTEPAEVRDALPGHKTPRNPPLAKSSQQQLPPEARQPSANTKAIVKDPLRAKPSATGKPPSVRGSRESARFLPPIVTRDFALAQTQPRIHPLEPARRPQPGTFEASDPPIEEGSQSFTLGGYVHIDRGELDSECSEMDRIIAIKKEAAAKALLKLQEVMSMPIWEKAPNIGLPRAPTKKPNYWRGLSIEDGSPIAPSAIFNQVKIPASRVPVSTHSTFPGGHEEGGLAPNGDNKGAKEDVKVVLNSSLRTSLDNGSRQRENISPESSVAPSWPGKRGRSDTAVPTVESTGIHSRISSSLSVNSSTSAHSLPYHMVPARGSSLRDDHGRLDDDGFGEPSSHRIHVGELGWR